MRTSLRGNAARGVATFSRTWGWPRRRSRGRGRGIWRCRGLFACLLVGIGRQAARYSHLIWIFGDQRDRKRPWGAPGLRLDLAAGIDLLGLVLYHSFQHQGPRAMRGQPAPRFEFPKPGMNYRARETPKLRVSHGVEAPNQKEDLNYDHPNHRLRGCCRSLHDRRIRLPQR